MTITPNSNKTDQTSIDQPQGKLWECVGRTETGYLFKFRYNSKDVSPDLMLSHFNQFFPNVESFNVKFLKELAKQLKEFGYGFTQDKTGTYLELPRIDHLQAQIEQKWPGETIGTDKNSNIYQSYLQHLIVISDGENFVSDQIYAMATLSKVVDTSNFFDLREKVRTKVTDLLKRIDLAEKAHKRGVLKGVATVGCFSSDVEKIKTFIEGILRGELALTGPIGFLESCEKSPNYHFMVDQFSDSDFMISSLSRKHGTGNEISSADIRRSWNNVFSYSNHVATYINHVSGAVDETSLREEFEMMLPEEIGTLFDDPRFHAFLEKHHAELFNDSGFREFLLNHHDKFFNDPRFHAFVMKYHDKFFDGMSISIKRKRFDEISKSKELNDWYETEERALKEKEGVMWEAVSRSRTEKGYIYKFKYKTHLHDQADAKILDLFPATEPTRSSVDMEKYISALRQFGFDYQIVYDSKTGQKDIYLSFPDRDHLQDCILKAYPLLGEIILNSEGIADDLSFAEAFLKYFLLMSDGKEFIHDSFAHALTMLMFIQIHGLDSFKSVMQISRDHITKLLKKAEQSKNLANNPILKSKIMTLIGLLVDGMWSFASEEVIKQLHNEIIHDEAYLEGFFTGSNRSRIQHFWKRIYGEDIDLQKARQLWDSI